MPFPEGYFSFRRDRRLSAALAAGMLLSTAGALWAGPTLGIGALLILVISLMGLLAGFAGLLKPADWAEPTMVAAEPLLLLPALLPGFVRGGGTYPAVILWGLALAAVSLFIIFFILGSGMRSRGTSSCREDDQAFPGVIFHMGIGVLLAAIFLPLAGPFLTAAAAVALRLASLPRKGIGNILLYASVSLLLVGMFLAEKREMTASGPPSPVKFTDACKRRWYVDGPAEICSNRGGVGTVSLAGGRYGWVLPPVSSEERHGYKNALSAKLAQRLMSRKPILTLGPAASARLEKISGKLPGEMLTLPGNRRLAIWYRAGASTKPSEEIVGEGVGIDSGIRGYLSGIENRFGLIYYVDLYDPEALSRGAASQDPAYHLTVESFESYLRALHNKGFLLMEVPFGLKVLGILKDIGSRENFTAGRHLLIYRDRAVSRDIVVFSREPLTRNQIVKLNRFAVKKNLDVQFYPGRRGNRSAFARLIRSGNARGFYTGLSTELTPPSDGRPFFYRVWKISFQGSSMDEVVYAALGIQSSPGWIPPADMPWAFLVVIGLGILLILSLEQRTTGGALKNIPNWRHRFIFFLYVTGFTLGLALRGGLMTLFRGDLGGLALLPVGALLLAAALVLGFHLVERGRKDPGAFLSPGARLMLPALLLPLLAGFMPESFWSLVPGLAFTALALTPPLVIGGMILWSGLNSCRVHRSLGECPALAFVGLGALTGVESAVPIAQTFGFAFALVLAWGILFVAVRVVMRVPRMELPEGSEV